MSSPQLPALWLEPIRHCDAVGPKFNSPICPISLVIHTFCLQNNIKVIFLDFSRILSAFQKLFTTRNNRIKNDWSSSKRRHQYSPNWQYPSSVKNWLVDSEKQLDFTGNLNLKIENMCWLIKIGFQKWNFLVPRNFFRVLWFRKWV